MPTYKLTYFDLTGLGEMIRYLFSYGDIEFEEVRVKLEEWAAVKPTLPWGVLPILEIDGETVTQSMPIARYLAKKVGLAVTDDWEDLQINIAIDIIHDFRVKLSDAYWNADEDVKKKKFAELEESYPTFLPKLDALAKDGYFANGRLSLADIFFASLSKYLVFVAGKNIFEGYENLNKVIATVEAIPNIQKWIKKRPETAM